MAIVVNGKKVAGVGLPGKDGAPGADGKDGAPGKSAYQAAKEKGYTGTEEEFNTALAGMQGAPFLSLAGGTMTGALTLSGPPTNENQAVTKAYADGLKGDGLMSAVGTFTGSVTLPFTPDAVWICLGTEVSGLSYQTSAMLAPNVYAFIYNGSNASSPTGVVWNGEAQISENGGDTFRYVALKFRGDSKSAK